MTRAFPEEGIDRLSLRCFQSHAVRARGRRDLFSLGFSSCEVGDAQCRVGQLPTTIRELTGGDRVLPPGFGEALRGRRSHRLPETHRGSEEKNRRGESEAADECAIAAGEFPELVHSRSSGSATIARRGGTTMSLARCSAES